MSKQLQVAIIGGGAAGFFASISVSRHHPDSRVVVFEKTSKLLSKVKVSGGGRCNVTNACFSESKLSKNYPRGGKQLKKAFSIFQATDTVEWFESRGVKLKAEADNRMFPITDSSQTIINCLIREAEKAGVEIRLRTAVGKMEKKDGGFLLDSEAFDNVIIATGGSPKLGGFDWLSNLGHEIVPPVPSLFTFNIPNNSVKRLMGVVVKNAVVRIQGTKLSHQGPVLITHWGMSGPAVLKLSAWGARVLEGLGYEFKIQVNWTAEANESEVNNLIDAFLIEERKKKMVNACPWDIPKKFWIYLLEKSGLDPDVPWLDLGKKGRNKLINNLLNDVYEVKGKTTFKEEFVTCGGVSLSDVDFKTMQSRVCPGMYFAGEVLDVDGVTGGFNFQTAWTTGFIAGQLGG